MPQLPFDVAEALNHLRINLSFCGDQIKTVMVTSSIPNEGKSFIAMQLWKMMAQVGTPVVLVDCDFRNSELRRKYGISSTDSGKLVGATHYLAGQTDIQSVIYRTNIANGYIIPTALSIANPTILLESPRFANLLETCRQQYGCVLIDTPPLGSVADALKIARQCDGSVLVIRSGQTTRKVAANSVRMLQRAGSPLLGVVLNRAEMKGRSSVYYRRYYRSNGYYSGYQYGSSGYGSRHSHCREDKENR